MTVLDTKREHAQAASSSSDAENAPSQSVAAALAEENLAIPPLEPDEDAPPAYGDTRNQIHFTEAGLDAGARITDDGRVNINITTKNNRLADLLRPAMQRQLQREPTLPPGYIPPSLGGKPGQEPPPKLNIVIMIVGSRGDVQPYIALGQVLKETYGHRVRVATHPTFQNFVEENGLEFFSIGGDPAELMAFMVKHPGLMPGFDALKNGEVSKRRKGIAQMLVGCWRSCIEAGNGLGPAPKPHAKGAAFDPSDRLPGDDRNVPFVADAIIANPPSFAHIHCAEKLGIPLHMSFTMPWTPTKAFPHPLANIQSTNADDVMTNFMSYTLLEMMTWQGLGDVINRFRENVLDIPHMHLTAGPGVLARLRVPYTYCWSPALIPKPNDWGNTLDVSGFFFLNLASSFTPEPSLAEFLESGPPPVYIGFGSIVVDDPNAMTSLIFEAVKKAGVRALVSKGWGGLGADDIGVPDGVYMLGNVPHDWLFQKVSAVVHHGGAGTTAAGIKAGKPTLVVPFFGDQPFWGAMIARANAGPDPIPFKQLTADNLAAALEVCLQTETQERAKELGQKIASEKGVDEGGQLFHKHLDIESLRCSLAPHRNAVWRVRRTKVKLSTLAATVLVDRGLIQYSDLKLYRPKEYVTESQPMEPFSAAASAVIMDISGIGLAFADMPRQLFKSARACSPHRDDKAKTEREGSQPASSSSSMQQAVRGRSQGGSKSNLSLVSSPDSVGAPSTLLGETESLTSEPRKVDDSDSTGNPTPGTVTPVSTAPSKSEPLKSVAQPQDKPCPPGADAFIEAGKGVGHIIGMGVRTPMNFTLGLAKGFRNMPRLYNDDTVRPEAKVSDFRSGLKTAGKELGFGFYDGVSGLVTQPLHGAEKEGAAGLVKGFGKGIAGLITKPAAGIYGIPAYTMQGLNAEVNKMFGRSLQNYITASRVAQGRSDLEDATPEEKDDVVMRWQAAREDLKPFYSMKEPRHRLHHSQSSKGKDVDTSSTTPSDNEQPRTGFWNTRHLSFDERKKLHAEKAARKKQQTSTSDTPRPTEAGSIYSMSSEDTEFEQAIRDSVKETSRGNPEEDVMVEAAMRASIRAMREGGVAIPEPEQMQPPLEKDPAIFKDPEYQVSDEQYQELVEKALQQSLAGQPSQQASGQASGPAGGDEEAELKRAIEASMKDVHKEDSQRTEEEIVMEYVKKQSLAEEELRKKQTEGSAVTQQGDEDAELKRAMEESLKTSHGGAGGPSGA